MTPAGYESAFGGTDIYLAPTPSLTETFLWAANTGKKFPQNLTEFQNASTGSDFL